MRALWAAVGAAAFTFTGDLAAQTSAQPMSFEGCLRTIRDVATQLATVPVNIVETDILRIVRFMTVDGSVLVSCSRPDRKMVITRGSK